MKCTRAKCKKGRRCADRRGRCSFRSENRPPRERAVCASRSSCNASSQLWIRIRTQLVLLSPLGQLYPGARGLFRVVAGMQPLAIFQTLLRFESLPTHSRRIFSLFFQSATGGAPNTGLARRDTPSRECVLRELVAPVSPAHSWSLDCFLCRARRIAKNLNSSVKLVPTLYFIPLLTPLVFHSSAFVCFFSMRFFFLRQGLEALAFVDRS